MKRRTLSSRDWVVTGIVAAVAFVYFTGGSTMLAKVGGVTGTESPGTVVVRVLLAIIIAAVMVAVERRRETPSIDAAAVEGIKVAAIVIIAENLFGITDSGARLALRSALVLVGLPLLAVITHVLSRRFRPVTRSAADATPPHSR